MVCPSVLTPIDWQRIVAEFRLSSREADVAALSIDGLTANEVARRLGISRDTATEYIKRIFVKTGVHSKFDLLLMIVRCVYMGEAMDGTGTSP